MTNKVSTTTTEKEITAQALGAALATLIVIVAELYLGYPAPTGLEGAVAVIVSMLIGLVRKSIRNHRNEQSVKTTDP